MKRNGHEQETSDVTSGSKIQKKEKKPREEMEAAHVNTWKLLTMRWTSHRKSNNTNWKEGEQGLMSFKVTVLDETQSI